MTESIALRFVADVSAATANIESMNRSLGRTQVALNKVAKVAGAVGFATFAAVGLGRAFTAGIRPAIEMEARVTRLTTAFQAVPGVVNPAGAALSEMQAALEFAGKTPMTIGEVTDAAIALRSVGVDPLTNSFKGLYDNVQEPINAMTILGDAAVQTGNSIGDMVFAYTRGAFGAGLDELAGRLKIPFSALSEPLSKLQKGTEAYRIKLLELIGANRQFQGAMEKFSNTLPGIFSMIKDAMYQISVAFAGSEKNSNSFFAVFKREAKSLMTFLQTNLETLKLVASALSTAFGTLLHLVKVLATPIISLLKLVTFHLGASEAQARNSAGQIKSYTERLIDFSEKTTVMLSMIEHFLDEIFTSIYTNVKAVTDFLGIKFETLLNGLGIVIGTTLFVAIIKLGVAVTSLLASATTLKAAGFILIVDALGQLSKMEWDNLDSLVAVFKLLAGLVLALGLKNIVKGISAITAFIALIKGKLYTALVWIIAKTPMKFLEMLRGLGTSIRIWGGRVVTRLLTGFTRGGWYAAGAAVALLIFDGVLSQFPEMKVKILNWWEDVILSMKRAFNSVLDFIGLGFDSFEKTLYRYKDGKIVFKKVQVLPDGGGTESSYAGELSPLHMLMQKGKGERLRFAKTAEERAMIVKDYKSYGRAEAKKRAAETVAELRGWTGSAGSMAPSKTTINNITQEIVVSGENRNAKDIANEIAGQTRSMLRGQSKVKNEQVARYLSSRFKESSSRISAEQLKSLAKRTSGG